MNKTKIAIWGIVALFAVITVSTVSADVTTLHFVPQDSNVTGYGDTVEVEVRADAPYGVNNGQVGIGYDQSCAKVVDLEFNPQWWMTEWNWSTSPCWGPGLDWIKWWKDPDSTGDVWLFTITIKGNSTEYCKTNLGIGYGLTGGPPCHMTVGNHTSGALEYTTVNGIFECGEAPPSDTFEKELVLGWNQISLSLYNETDMTVANIIFDSLSGSYSDLYRYDAVTKDWVLLSSSDTMQNGIGYFINMTKIDTWSYSGQPYKNMGVSLSEGLNCIGWTNTGASINVTEENALGSITDKYNYVAQWNNAPSPKYEVYEQHAPDVFNDFWMMERGGGYWIAAKEDCTLTYQE